jgi:hypothetical protein
MGTNVSEELIIPIFWVKKSAEQEPVCSRCLGLHGRYIPEDGNIHNYRCENLKSDTHTHILFVNGKVLKSLVRSRGALSKNNQRGVTVTALNHIPWLLPFPAAIIKSSSVLFSVRSGLAQIHYTPVSQVLSTLIGT